MNRRTLRALLATAAVTVAIGLAGCNPDSVAPTGRAQAPLSEKTLSLMEEKHMDKGSPILARIFKEEAEMEIWKKTRDGDYALLKTYPICRWSGDLGPKKREGDRQAPEGIYTITRGQMNPASNYYLAFNTGFPNVYDRAMGYTGSELMVHGDCSSRGCYAMTDEQIQEIYTLARESFFGGQTAFQLQAFPFRMTALNMARHRSNPNFAFWKMLKEGYDHFEATRQEPKVAVCDKHYVFDAAAPENSSRPLRFDAKGKCPVYELDKNLADAVLEKQRSEQFEMAQYIARGVAETPSRAGIDGGMNPVFAAKLAPHNEFDNNGRAYQVAGNAVAPGALPRTPGRAGTAAETPQARQERAQNAPVVAASVPVPQAKEGEAPPEKPKSIAGLIGNMFRGSQSQAEPTPAATEQVNLRVSNSDASAKTRPTPIRAASAPILTPPKPRQDVPKAVADNAVKPTAKPQQPEQAETSRTPAPDMRTAYAPPANDNGLLVGAQPVVPAGSFDNRWSGLR